MKYYFNCYLVTMQTTTALLQVLNNLNFIKRTGPNLFAGIPNHNIESIAEHSYKVAYLCLIFSKKFEDINLENLLTYVLIDEWGEVIIGDLPTSSSSYKRYFETDIRKLHKDAEIKAQKVLLDDAALDKPKLSKTEKDLYEFCDILARTFELLNFKTLGYKHKWIEKMFKIQLELLMKYRFDFTYDLVEELKNIYKKGMDNKYLTKNL